MRYKYEKDGQEFRLLRMKAGFITIADAARHIKCHYRTWQGWELGIVPAPELIYLYLELFIKTKQNPYPK